MTSSKPPIQLPRGIYYGWVIVAICWMANWVTATLNPVVFSIFIVPLRDDLRVSLSALAWCISIRMLAAGITAPILGRLVDRYGARWVGFCCAIGSGSSMIALSFAPNIWVMYLLFGLSGLTGFGVFGGGQILTGVPPSNWFIAQRGRANAFTMAGGSLGTAFWVFISSLLVVSIGWRASWLIYGILILVTLLPAYGFLMRRRPEDVGLYPDGASAPPQQARPAAGQQGGSVPAPRATAQETNFTLAQSIRSPILWFAVMGFTLHTFSTNGILFMRVPFWRDMGLSPQLIGLAVASDPFVVMLCSLAFGFLAEHFPVRFIAAFGGLVRGGAMVVLLLTQPYISWVFAHNIVWGVGSAGMGTGQSLLLPNYFGRLALGSIRGFIAPFMIAAGAVGAPFVGYMMDAGVSSTIIFWIAMGMMLSAGATFLFLKPPRPPQPAASAQPVSEQART